MYICKRIPASVRNKKCILLLYVSTIFLVMIMSEETKAVFIKEAAI